MCESGTKWIELVLEREAFIVFQGKKCPLRSCTLCLKFCHIPSNGRSECSSPSVIYLTFSGLLFWGSFIELIHFRVGRTLDLYYRMFQSVSVPLNMWKIIHKDLKLSRLTVLRTWRWALQYLLLLLLEITHVFVRIFSPSLGSPYAFREVNLLPGLCNSQV